MLKIDDMIPLARAAIASSAWLGDQGSDFLLPPSSSDFGIDAEMAREKEFVFYSMLERREICGSIRYDSERKKKT